MKKTILSIFVIGIILSSCKNNEKKATTKDAEKVSIVKTQTTTTLKTLGSDSFVNWRASHLGGVKKRYGKIFFKDATFLINNGQLTNATATINMASLTVESFPEGSEQIVKLEGHLKSADFFNVEKHPTSKFELVKIEKSSGAFNSKITGNLTIAGITKSITFNANVTVSDNKATLKSEDFSINRADWSLTYNAEGTKGVPVDYLIANKIGLTINISVTK